MEVLKRDKIKSKPKQKIKLNNIERTQRVRGQTLYKIEFDPKRLRILSDKFVNQICLIVNAFQFEIMYICGKLVKQCF